MYCAVIKEDNMKKSLKKILAFTKAAAMAAGLAACGSSASTSPSAGGSGSAPAVSDEPIKISMYYADNPTLPYMDSWLAVQETAKIAGVDLTVEAIPSTDYNTKVSLALNTGENCPDVILIRILRARILRWRSTEPSSPSAIIRNGRPTLTPWWKSWA